MSSKTRKDPFDRGAEEEQDETLEQQDDPSNERTEESEEEATQPEKTRTVLRRVWVQYCVE